MAPDREEAEPPLTSRERREFRELLQASRSTRSVIVFIKYTAGWITAVTAAIATLKIAFGGWFLGR